MLIENPDAFKTWLTSVLEPLCDADPEALAKYVFALVKKDKAVDALRQGMIEQLDVFLQTETKPFVELLFKTIESQEYLMIPNTNPPNPNPPPGLTKNQKEPDQLIVKEMKPIIPVNTLPNLSESINGNLAAKKSTEESVTPAPPPPQPPQPPPVMSSTTGSSNKRDHRKSESEKDDQRRRRNRSRSRSWDRGLKRSRSRDRSPRRSRPWRNKSPPLRRGYDRERRRSRSGSPAGRVRSRSRSPRHSGYRGGSTRYRNRSPPRSVSRSRSRSADRQRGGGDKDKKDKDGKEENSGGATPTQDSNHGDTDMRLTSTTQSIQSVVSAAVALGPGTGAAPGAADAAPQTYKRRCRDFDEKGYCMRGEMCPYDHGVDPVVLEDTALSRVLAFGPNGAPLDQGQHAPTHQMPTRPIMEYNPSAPGIWHHRPGFRPRVMPLGPRGAVLPPGAMPPTGPPFVPLPSMQRELINVPVTDMQSSGGGAPSSGGPHGGGGFKRRANMDFGPDSNSTPPKRKQGNFDFNRLGPRTSAPKNPANCSLELKKVPRGLNNITHLNNHFSKFGKIINIQVNFEGDGEGALVTFSSHAEANAAYRSTEAVLNNRFIKVFWHSSAENVPPPSQNQPQMPMNARAPVKERLGQPPNANKVLNLVQPKAAEGGGAEPPGEEAAPAAGTPAPKPAVYVPSNKTAASADSKALAHAAIVKGQEILAAKEQLKKKHEEKRKEAMKITQDLRKRKQELLEKQLAQQKLLIEKLEKTNPTGQQRELLMTTIKTVQESIESIRKDMMMNTSLVPAAGASPRTPAAPRKSKEEAQREVLDAELDLITRQQEGGDCSELQRRLQELRAQALSLTRGGGGSAGGARRGRGAAAGRHRGHHVTRAGNLVLDRTRTGSSKTHNVVDHRPTRLLVSGYEADESDSVLAHFAQYGEISDYITDPSTPSIILNYKTRKEAEVALLKGRNFQDRTLSVTWSLGAPPRGSAPSRPITKIINNNGDDNKVEKTTAEDNSLVVAAADATKLKLDDDDDQIDDEDDDDDDDKLTKIEEGIPIANITTVGTTVALLAAGDQQTVLEEDEGDEDAGAKDLVAKSGNGTKETDAAGDGNGARVIHTNEEQLLEGDDENVGIGEEYTEEVLLQDDEDDDEREEDRSWRR